MALMRSRAHSQIVGLSVNAGSDGPRPKTALLTHSRKLATTEDISFRMTSDIFRISSLDGYTVAR